MKNPHIILKEDGLCLIKELPEKPAHIDMFTKAGMDVFYKYEQDYKQSIKDAVKLKDQKFALRFLRINCLDRPDMRIEKDRPYKADLSGYDVTRGYNHSRECRLECTCNVDDEVAILTPKSKSIVDHEKFYEIERRENSATPTQIPDNLPIHELSESDPWQDDLDMYPRITPDKNEYPDILPPKKDGSLCGNFPRISKENSAHSFTEGSEIFPSGTRSERDYTEDFKLENGNYQNKCIKCEQLFYGYKRRVVCNVCSKPSVQEESQEKLWKEFHDNYIRLEHAHQWVDLKNKFTITRKPKKI